MCTPPRLLLSSFVLWAIFCHPASATLDSNADRLPDVWQWYYDARQLNAEADDDGDGLSNFVESRLGTDPHDAACGLSPALAAANGRWQVRWPGRQGKRYRVEVSPDLSEGSWTTFSTVRGDESDAAAPLDFGGDSSAPPRFFVRLQTEDMDTDGDGVDDWDEFLLGFNPRRRHTEGLGSTSSSNPVTDFHRIRAILAAPSSKLTLAAIDPAMEENWPDAGVIVVRRSGWWSTGEISRLDPLTVNLSLGGTATVGVDYDAPSRLSVTFGWGEDEAYLRLIPRPDDLIEPEETILVTLREGEGYTLGDQRSAKLTLADGPEGAPGVKEAARFLIQATFGPTDAEIARVRAAGMPGWIEQQLARPAALHRPLVQQWSEELMAAGATNPNPPSESRIEAWWRLALRDGDDADPLRQRIAFALSEIFVISDRLATVHNDQRGVADYYDLMVRHAFGNFRDLLGGVAHHPMMGVYLSSLRNRKADPALNRYPDENFAREVMQLFTLGLWRLRPDGTRLLSDGSDLGPDGAPVPAGEPIPAYGQAQVATLARIFTGLSFSTRTVGDRILREVPVTRFNDDYNVGWRPMRMFDSEHDLEAKTLWFPGRAALELPAGPAPLPGLDLGLAGEADITATLDYLFAHPNIGPFLSRQLIQRLVTSNPGPAYVGRVAAAFADNGAGVRGDLGAVVRAILLDEEARDFGCTLDPRHGMVREPYVRYVALARALGAGPAASSAGGRYRGFDGLGDEFGQRPLSSPSVFNFYSPEYRPQGELRDAGLVSPEMQITNSITAIATPNRFSMALDPNGADSFTGPEGAKGFTQFNRSTVNDNAATADDERRWNTRADEDAWLALATGDPDALIARLDRLLCAGRMTPATFRAVSRSLRRTDDPAATSDALLGRRRALLRFRLATLLITTSADYCVLP